ncbi:UNVERIFIED_CONTAM: hypothetical protein Slati_4486300 [Sesamum latifolium]|uniref:Uncharacterized protein n=1 Tax=Sesamum latifolium TaxID=2727402 RepID=A0AAW2SUF6_9LAMI
MLFLSFSFQNEASQPIIKPTPRSLRTDEHHICNAVPSPSDLFHSTTSSVPLLLSGSTPTQRRPYYTLFDSFQSFRNSNTQRKGIRCSCGGAMAVPPVKSQPLHNFSLPHLKWAHKNSSSSASGSTSHQHRLRRHDSPINVTTATPTLAAARRADPRLLCRPTVWCGRRRRIMKQRGLGTCGQGRRSSKRRRIPTKERRMGIIITKVLAAVTGLSHRG